MSNSTTMGLLIMSNPVFECYAFYGCILILKTIAMSFITAFQRMKKKVCMNPEDVVLRQGAEVKFDDPDIERIRRAHLNDLENIPIFLITGLLFVTSNPPEMLANNLFRIYTLTLVGSNNYENYEILCILFVYVLLDIENVVRSL
ncbi:Membrane associated eicosanoid/glutathione metabolism-like domain,Membrane-associated [Cinara cedri]|uniref:Microsomal glutathione S-transferase 1 n=1 Tax=Cinara cedri TaxID=506608 RepID=A0A5E4N5F2_9HEMI|nr:Membrane associated eicosanoid/glutathione metabolism-like domain,Membrane-associated [Cinara cedri]